jgi:hypothetical protein
VGPSERVNRLLDQRKEAKLQWLHEPSEIKGDNLNNVRREASRHFRNITPSERVDRLLTTEVTLDQFPEIGIMPSSSSITIRIY